MFVVLAALWISIGSQGTLAITVSPSVGILGNASAKFIINSLSVNKTFDNNDSITDRNRRLIPYLTFYTPQDFPLAQKYSYSGQEHQQQQNAALYQTHYLQRIPVEQHEQDNAHQLPFRYPQVPVEKQKYHSVLYGSRYPNSHSDAQDIQHQVMPSYPNSNLHQPHFSTRVNLTPFVPSNKLPGKFTPIIYVHPIDSINYNKQSQPNKGSLLQYDEVPNQHHNYEEDEQIPVEQNSTPNPKTSNVALSTIRPFYHLLHDLPLRQMHLQSLPALREPDNSVHLTPQQKYVKYLREQLRSKQKQEYEQRENQQQVQQKEHAFIINTSPSPSPDRTEGINSDILSHVKPEGNVAIYQFAFEPPTGQYNFGKGLPPKQSSTTEQGMLYSHMSTTRPVNIGHSTSSYPARFNNNGEYLEVLISKTHQNANFNPAENSNFQEVFGTTPSPVKVTSQAPVYNHQKSETLRVVEIPKSVKSHSNPVPVKSYQAAHREIPKYKKISQATFSRKPIIQHLTETTQVPLPILTTYHPNIIVTKPRYYSSTSTTRPLKTKVAQKLKPVLVARPTIQIKPVNKSPQEQNAPTNFTHSSLVEILHKLQDNNQLPKTFTPENIDNSIRTLIRILNDLKRSQTVVDTNPPQHQDEEDEDYENVADIDTNHPGPNSGRAGIDYPALAEIPPTSFSCKEQRYKGFFGDPETHCQVWHYCDLNGGQASFLCPNGTIFSQVALTCDWWFNVKCSSTAQLYVLNERLYKYILPLTPKFPEDYSGPLVDKYLALKFKEMEEKLRREKTKGKEGSDEASNVKDDTSNEEQENGSDSEEVSTTQSNENTHTQIQDNVSVVPTTSVPSLQSMPIVVTSTEEPFSPTTSAKTSVESEKVEVIEIKNDGTSGRIIQTRLYSSGLKK